MSFWKKLYTGVRIGLAVAAAVNGKKVGSRKIQIKEIPDIVDLVETVEVVVKAAKSPAEEAPSDGNR